MTTLARTAEEAASTWPPPPHDPRERCVLQERGGWAILAIPVNDPRHAYFAPRGFLHLQLWHDDAGLSVLTPSRLTNGQYEVWWAGRRRRVRCFCNLAQFLTNEAGVQPVCPRSLGYYTRWFVHAFLAGATPRCASDLANSRISN